MQLASAVHAVRNVPRRPRFRRDVKDPLMICLLVDIVSSRRSSVISGKKVAMCAVDASICGENRFESRFDGMWMTAFNRLKVYL